MKARGCRGLSEGWVASLDRGEPRIIYRANLNLIVEVLDFVKSVGPLGFEPSRCGERNSGCLRIWQALAHNDRRPMPHGFGDPKLWARARNAGRVPGSPIDVERRPTFPLLHRQARATR